MRDVKESQLGARPANFVAIEEVVGAGIVLVDSLLDQAHAQDLRIKLNVPGGLSRHRRDVV